MFLIDLSVCVLCLFICTPYMYIMFVPGAFGGQKELDALGLELQMVVNHVGAEFYM